MSVEKVLLLPGRPLAFCIAISTTPFELRGLVTIQAFMHVDIVHVLYINIYFIIIYLIQSFIVYACASKCINLQYSGKIDNVV